MIYNRYRTLVLTILVMTSSLAWGEDQMVSKKLKVFPDCKRFDCPWDYLLSNLNLVDIVRDPKDVDIHLLVILKETSSEEM